MAFKFKNLVSTNAIVTSPTPPNSSIPSQMQAMTKLCAHLAEILGDPYSKKTPLPSIGDFPHLDDSPKLSSYQVLGQSRIQQRHTTRYNHPRIEAQ
jgi:hypothetical protein